MSSRVMGFVRASHAAPTAVVTLVVVLLAAGLGWRGWPLAGVFVAVGVGQLSVGWSNDAFDAPLDKRSHRLDKPTVALGISSRALWAAAVTALVIACALSWLVAGAIGGSWHVFALAMAWLYNTVLSRTWWSWLPYALAFGSIPAFLTYGLDGQPPLLWLTAVCAIVGVSAHVANALPDMELDRQADVNGFVMSMGRTRATWLCWILLVAGSVILAVETFAASAWIPTGLGVALTSAALYARLSRSRTATFQAILALVVVQVVVLLLATAAE
ncbi:MAG: UbiA family prenyltransferase [Actinomycetota bacterium]